MAFWKKKNLKIKKRLILEHFWVNIKYPIGIINFWINIELNIILKSKATNQATIWLIVLVRLGEICFRVKWEEQWCDFWINNFVIFMDVLLNCTNDMRKLIDLVSSKLWKLLFIKFCNCVKYVELIWLCELNVNYKL